MLFSPHKFALPPWKILTNNIKIGVSPVVGCEIWCHKILSCCGGCIIYINQYDGTEVNKLLMMETHILLRGNYKMAPLSLV